MTAVTARQAAGILDASVDFASYAPDQTNALASLSESCERKLKASLVMVGKDLYVSDDGKSVDSLSSLEIASILVRYGNSSPDRASWKSAGHLIASTLAGLTGDKGSLSAQFAFTGASGGEPQTPADRTGVAPKDDKVLDAATVYPSLVTNNSWYPHAVSLALDAGPRHLGMDERTVGQSHEDERRRAQDHDALPAGRDALHGFARHQAVQPHRDLRHGFPSRPELRVLQFVRLPLQ